MIPVGSINERVKRRSVDKYFQIGIVWNVIIVWSVGNEALSGFSPHSSVLLFQVSDLSPHSSVLRLIPRGKAADGQKGFLLFGSQFPVPFGMDTISLDAVPDDLGHGDVVFKSEFLEPVDLLVLKLNLCSDHDER